MSNSIANTQTTNILPVQALYDPTTLAFITFIGPAGLPFTSAAGGVSSVNVSGGTTGLTTSGGPIVSSGTITLGGTLSVSNGGTGSTTSAGALTNLLPTQTGNSGKFLTTDGTNTSWSVTGGGLSVTDDTTTNATRYLTFTNATSGTITSENVASTKLTFNPSSGALSSTTFVGALTGNASSATIATTASNVAGGSAGALLYQSSSGNTTFLSIGSNGQYLTLAGGVPVWSSLSPVTSFSAGTTGFTPNTATTGAVTLSGTLNVANGGTGVTTSTGASSVVLRDANSNITFNNTLPGYTTTTTASGTTTLTNASSYHQRFIGSAVQTIKLPDATTMAQGQGFIIDNDSSSNLTLQDGASGALGVVVPGMAAYVFNEINTTVAGNWSGYLFVPGGGPSGQVTWGTAGLSMGGQTISSSTWNGTAIGATYGGTGQTAYTTGDILYASATNTLSKLGVGSTNQVLTIVGGVPTWAATTAATSITDDTTTNATRYINFTSATTGTLSTIYTSSTKLQYNPSTGVLTSTGFAGALNGTVGATTPSTGVFTTVTANTAFLGDFTNATVASRAYFQTTTTNGTTGIYALPNGTSTASSWQATNNSNPTNASKILIATNGSTDVQLVSGINGTGTYLPLSFYTNGAQKGQINLAGDYTAVGNVVAQGGLHLNAQTISTSYSIPSGYSASSAGPITLSTGVSVTVPSGSRWIVL